MGAVDWTEKCRDDFPESAGYLDLPFDGSESLSDIVPYLNESTRAEIDDQEDDSEEDS